MWFRGQKVICIYGGNWRWRSKSPLPSSVKLPVQNQMYTIRDIEYFPKNNVSGIRLVEITTPEIMLGVGWREPCFFSAKFRPVVEKKTDISIFTEMLKPVDALV